MAAAGTRAVHAALIGNLLVAGTKFAAATMTGSSAMMSEAVHSVVDTLNEVLLLYGIRRSRRQPDREHPLGHGRELYFWSFIVALMIFGLGAIASIVQGVAHINGPEPVKNPAIVYIVLGLSLIFEGGSWLVSFRGFRACVGEDGYLAAIRRSKNPPQFVVLLEDSAAIIGIAIAFAGTWASVHWADPWIDGMASIAIGCLLVAVAILLGTESKALLIGERADAALQDAMYRIASETEGIVCPRGLITVQLAPDQVVVALSLEFEDRLTVPEVEKIVEAMEERIRSERPEVHLLFVKPQDAAAFAVARRRLLGTPADIGGDVPRT